MFVNMPSYTFALKAQKILKARGYLCEIKRKEIISAEGCGYYIKTDGDYKNIREILEKHSVPFGEIGKEVLEE